MSANLDISWDYTKIRLDLFPKLGNRRRMDDMSNITFPTVLPDDDGIRTAGNPDECFYCQSKVGEQHKPDCVCVLKRVKVRYSFEIEVSIPWGWDAQNFEFHRNESSWCANNAIDEIQESIKGEECLCQGFKAEFIEEISDRPFARIREPEVE